MAAVPEVGRATQVERGIPTGAEATHDLYERFKGQIFGYCLHQLGSREEAEDAVQTTFMNVFRGLQRGIVPELESAWLFKIAQNVCLSRRRSASRRGRIEAPNNFEVLQEVVPARDRTRDELIPLQEVLEAMPESQRRAILLREWKGLSYREIAEELDVSPGAVETLIFRARRALAAGLEQSAPNARWRTRVRHGLDASGVLAGLKALLTGGTAVKIAATVAAVATTAVVASSAAHHGGTVRRVPAAVKIAAPVGAVTAMAQTHAVPRVVPQRARPAPVASRQRRVASMRRALHPRRRESADSAAAGRETAPPPVPAKHSRAARPRAKRVEPHSKAHGPKNAAKVHAQQSKQPEDMPHATPQPQGPSHDPEAASEEHGSAKAPAQPTKSVQDRSDQDEGNDH